MICTVIRWLDSSTHITQQYKTVQYNIVFSYSLHAVERYKYYRMSLANEYWSHEKELFHSVTECRATCSFSAKESSLSKRVTIGRITSGVDVQPSHRIGMIRPSAKLGSFEMAW